MDFFDRAEAGPENYRDIVSIIVDRDTYWSQRSRILRYADDIAGYLGGVRTSILVVDNETPVATIATKNEKLYYEWDGEKGTSNLVGTVLIWNIPIPIVEKDGIIFSSLFPYVDFDDKAFIYNPKTTQYEYAVSNNGTEAVDIWHGVINPSVGRNWSGVSDIAKIWQFLDKTHDFYTKSWKFTLNNIPPKVFHYDGFSESKSISARGLFQYALAMKNSENIVYNRFTKYLLRDISKALADFDAKESDPETTAMYASLGLPLWSDSLSEDQIQKLPDIQTKNVSLSFLKNFKSIFNDKALGEELLSIHNAGRYTNTATTRSDILPISITLMDDVARSTLYESNTALEKKIDSLLTDQKYAKRIPIFDEILTASGIPIDRANAFTNISQNYVFWKQSTAIRNPLDCTIARGSMWSVTDFGRSQLVEANVAFDILKTDAHAQTLTDDTSLLVGMRRADCFPWGTPAMSSYWGGNSILRIVWSSSDPAEVLQTFPATAQFKWFSAPIFSLWGMKESNRLSIWSVWDCTASSWYQYTLSPARLMTYIETWATTSQVCTTAYPSEWTYWVSWTCSLPSASSGISPRYTCISNLASTGVTITFPSSISNYQTTWDCMYWTLTLDGTSILKKNNYCSITEVDASGATYIIDVTQYQDQSFHSIPSLFKHVSPTDEEISAANINTMTPSLPVDMVRYVEFITPKWNTARLTYPNFFDAPWVDILSVRNWLKNIADSEWQIIIARENATTPSAIDITANAYLAAGTIPPSPIDWNAYISDDTITKILQAKHWLNPNISAKYKQAIESILSYSHEDTSVRPIIDTAPKIPAISSEYEIAYLGLPSHFGVDFSQAMQSQSMMDYQSQLREIEWANISEEIANDVTSWWWGNSAAACGPPDGVPLFQWPSAIMCWIKAQFPPKILAGSCSPTQIGISSPDKKVHNAPPDKIATDSVALTSFYAGWQLIASLPRSSMTLNESITVALNLQKNNAVLDVIPNTVAHLEVIWGIVWWSSIPISELSKYLNITPNVITVGEKWASFILESQGLPAVLSLKWYYIQTLPDGTELRIDSSEFQIRVSPEYFSLLLEQSGLSITNIDVTTPNPVFLKTQKVLESGTSINIDTPVSISIIDDVTGNAVYSLTSFNPSRDPLPLDVTKKIGVYRVIIKDKDGISGEITFAVQSWILSQIRVIPISSALVRWTKTLAMIRLLDRLGNPTSPEVHSLKLDIAGWYIVDSNGEKKTNMNIDIMESQIPIILGADSPWILSINASIDGTITSNTDITIYNSARIVLMRDSSPFVWGKAVWVHIEIQDDVWNRMSWLSSVASWKLPDGAGKFSKDAIAITDGVSENFDYIPGTVSGNHALSIDIPGIGSISDIVFSLLPWDPMYISHTKDDTNIIFSLRDRYDNISTFSTLAGTISRDSWAPQSIVFVWGKYTIPLQWWYYTVNVPWLKNNLITYTDDSGAHSIQWIDRYVAYIVGKNEKLDFAPDYNSRYTVLAGWSFLREGEDILYNTTPWLSQSLAVSTVLDSPMKEDILLSILPGWAFHITGVAQDMALHSNISLSDGFPLLTVSDQVTQKQVARIVYRMQNAQLETCQESDTSACDIPKKNPTIRLIIPNKSSLNMANNGNTMVLNTERTNILTVNNNGSIGISPSISLEPKENTTFGLEMSVIENDQEIATLVYMMDSNQSVVKQDTVNSIAVNTPIILSSWFSIESLHSDPIHTNIIWYKILRPVSSDEIDETKNGPIHTDSIGASSEIPGVGWSQNNTMLLAYAWGDTVGESSRFFHTYSFVNLGDPVTHVDHWRANTEIDWIDRTVGSIITRGARTGIANFFHKDMDADGMEDLVILYDDGYIELFLNRGGKFRSRGMITYNKDLDTKNIAFGDFTSDGFGDIIGLSKDGWFILINNSNRRFSRLNITLLDWSSLPQNISQFHTYDMDADGYDDIIYISASWELAVLYGTVTAGSFSKKILDPTLGITLSSTSTSVWGAIKATNTPQIQWPLWVSPPTSVEFDDSMLNDEVYYQYTHWVAPYSTEVDANTLGSSFTDITNGATGDRTDTYIRSQYATAYGLNIEKVYTNITHPTLSPGDHIQAHISIRNTTASTIKDIEYLDTLPKIFSVESTQKYSVRIWNTSIDRPFEPITSGEYDIHFTWRDLAPGETMDILYDMIALPASYGEMIVGDLEKGTVGADIYGDVGFKTSTTCGASMLVWVSGPGIRDFIKWTHNFGSPNLPDGLEAKLIDSNNNQIPDSIENMSLSDRQAAYKDMNSSNNTSGRPLIKADRNGAQITIWFDDDAVDTILDSTQYLLDGLACWFGWGSCMSFPVNWAPLAPGSDPAIFGIPIGDGLKIGEGLPIFSALTFKKVGKYCVPTVWPVSVKNIWCIGQWAWWMLGIYNPANFLRIFVTPTLTLGMWTAICLGWPAALQGKVPPPALSPLIQGWNCIIATKAMNVCKGDGSKDDGDVAPISGLGTMTDTWNAMSCSPQANVTTEVENKALTTNIVGYLKNPDKSKLQDIYSRISKRGPQSLSVWPLLRVASASGGGWDDLSIEINSNTRVADIGNVIKLNNKRIPAFPDFLMDWLTRQTEELVTSFFTPPNLTIVLPTDLGQNAQIDGSYKDFSKKLGDAYSSNTLSNMKQGMSQAFNSKQSNISGVPSSLQSTAQNAKGTLNALKSAYTTIGKLPFIKINPVKIPFNIPWINARELEKYGRALDGYLKEIDSAAKNLCISDPSAACLDKKAKLQSWPFIASIRENLKRIEEYKRFPMKIQKYLTWKERYIAQILCNIQTIQKITGGWLRDNGIRFRKWAELFVLIKSIAESWQPLLNIFNDASISCGVCRNERSDLKHWKIKLISSLLPSIPVIRFPKWPDVVLDLSDIRFAIIISMPEFDPRISPIRLPNLPWLSIGDISASLSLPALPILPPLPPLPDLPDLPSLPRIKLPDLPPPPKLPKISGSIQLFLKVMKLISKMYCYYQKTSLVPEWQAGDVIAQRTQRQATSLFDFIKIQLPGFTLPSIKEIKVWTHVNFELRSEFIAEFSRSAVKPVNKFGTDLQRILPSKIAPDVGIGNTNININKKLPYNIQKVDKTSSGELAMLIETIDSLKDDFLDIDEFISYLKEELNTQNFSNTRINLERDLAVAKIESEKIQNELITYNDKRFDLLRDYLKAENDSSAQLQGIVNLLSKEISWEPRQLIADITNISSHSQNLLEHFNTYQSTNWSSQNMSNLSVQSSNLDKSRISFQRKISRMIAANGTSLPTTTNNISAGYSPNYRGIYIQTPISGTQTQLFDYQAPLTEDTTVESVDIDKDGDMDYLFLLDGILYIKYSWLNNPSKIIDTTQKISSIGPSDLLPYIPNYFYENSSTPKVLNFSFTPSSHEETEWRVDFFDQYTEWDKVDIWTHNPIASPKTTVDMMLRTSSIPVSGSPILATSIARSLTSVQDRWSFIIEWRSIEVFTGALSISLSPGRVLYTWRDSVTISYKIINSSEFKTITIAPHTGYEFSDITEITSNWGLFYLIGEQDHSKYMYSDDYIGLPILPGMQIYASDGGAIIKDHTSWHDIALGWGATYITYDLGDRSESYNVSLPYANWYYYARLRNLTSNKMDRAWVILFSPQVSSDTGSPVIDLPNTIRIPIYSNKTYKLSNILTDLSKASISIDNDLTVDTNNNGIFDDDFVTAGIWFSLSNTDFTIGAFTTPGNYNMIMRATDEMWNTTIFPFTIEAYSPVPEIQSIVDGKIKGKLSEETEKTPISFFRIRPGELPTMISPTITTTNNLWYFSTGLLWKSPELVTFKTNTTPGSISNHGLFQLPPWYYIDIVPASENTPMQLLTLNSSWSISYVHTISLPEDINFIDLSKKTNTSPHGIFITPTSLFHMVMVSSTDVSIPWGTYIIDSTYWPIVAIARDGNIYTLDKNLVLKYGEKNGYMIIQVVGNNGVVATIEYHLDFFYTMK